MELGNTKNMYKSYYISETESLLNRIRNVKSFDLTMPMVNAARLSPKAEEAIQKTIGSGIKELKKIAMDFLVELKKPNPIEVYKLQQMLTKIKLRFNAVLEQLDIFSDVVSQRGEHETGVLMAGLDRLALNGLEINTTPIDLPIVCFLERGIGAAIRRYKTPLPGGKENPVAIIQVPRERMPGLGVGSSLIHEVGHQVAALLNLNESVEEAFKKSSIGKEKEPWLLFTTWTSEILADFWSVAKLGIGSTMGLISVLSLPSHFIFKLVPNDPHPIPYIRVKISCAIGEKLYPDKQWEILEAQWEKQYPIDKLKPSMKELVEALELEIDEMVNVLVAHKPESLNGLSLKDIFSVENMPLQLRKTYNELQKDEFRLTSLNPISFFAILGQAKADQKLKIVKEGELVKNALKHWALKKN